MTPKAKKITEGAAIASVYIVLTLIANAFGIGSGVIQVRFSEMLTILPVFTSAAIPGLFVGCLVANLLSGALPPDVIFGSIATLAGAFGTYALRRHPYLSPIVPVAANTLIIPFVLSFVYGAEGSTIFFMATVGIGEVISCWGLGIVLYRAMKKYKNVL